MNPSLQMRRGLLVSALLALSGCFPVELDVSPDGKILIPRGEGFFSFHPSTKKVELVYKPDSGKPIFGRFAPDGRGLLAVTESPGAMMGKSFDFFLVSLPDKKARKIYMGGNATYALFSPNGKYVSVSQLAASPKPPLEEQLPEIYLISSEDGSSRLLLSNVGSFHRWLPDSKSLLVFSISGKDKEKSQYSGSLAVVDAATGKKKAVVDALGGKDFFLSLSPNGHKAFFTAVAAGKPGTKLDGTNAKLFEVTLKTQEVRDLGEGIKYAMYSPAGDRILLGSASKDNNLKLEVADAALTSRTQIADGIAGSVGGSFGGGASVYPGWVGNSALYFLSDRAVYGTEGKNLELVVADASGGGSRAYQSEIESAIAQGGESGWAPPAVVAPAPAHDLKWPAISGAGALLLGLLLGRLFFRK